jgi:hypothetical protein
VSAAFLRQSRALKESDQAYGAKVAKILAALSMMLILLPLFLTAIFITRTLLRNYVGRQLNEVQRHAARAGEDEAGGLSRQESGMSGNLAHLPDAREWGAGMSQNGVPQSPKQAGEKRICA